MRKLLSVFAAVIIVALAVAISVVNAGGGVMVYEHTFVTKIEPIEGQVVRYFGYRVFTGQPVVAEFKLINHSQVPWALGYKLSIAQAVDWGGNLLVDPDGPGPVEYKSYAFGSLIRIAPGGEQYFQFSVVPAVASTDATGPLKWQFFVDRYVPGENSGVKAYEFQFETKVEPVEVQLTKYPDYQSFTGQTVVAEYKLINHSSVPWQLNYDLYNEQRVDWSGVVAVSEVQNGAYDYWTSPVVIKPNGELYVHISVVPALISTDDTGPLRWNFRVYRSASQEKGGASIPPGCNPSGCG